MLPQDYTLWHMETNEEFKMNDSTDINVLFSGGVDSLGALLYALNNYKKENITVIYCKMNHTYEEKEINAAKKICKKLKIKLHIDETLTGLGRWEETNANIPLRNAFLIMVATLYGYNDNKIIIIQNIQRGEIGPDRNIDFNILTQTLIMKAYQKNNTNLTNLTVISPYSLLTKSEILIAIMDFLKERKGIIYDTIGCFSSVDGHCGECNSCFRRFIAFEAVGASTNKMFNKDIKEWDGIKDYVTKMNDGFYDYKRRDETFHVLHKYKILQKYLDPNQLAGDD